MIVVMRDDKVVGNEGCAMTSFTARCGSAVIRHMLRDGDVFRECGMLSFPGFKRFLSTTCFFVVRISQIGSWLSKLPPDSELSLLSSSRFLVVDSSAACFCLALICCSKAEEARITCHFFSTDSLKHTYMWGMGNTTWALFNW